MYRFNTTGVYPPGSVGNGHNGAKGGMGVRRDHSPILKMTCTIYQMKDNLTLIDILNRTGLKINT